MQKVCTLGSVCFHPQDVPPLSLETRDIFFVEY